MKRRGIAQLLQSVDLLLACEIVCNSHYRIHCPLFIRARSIIGHVNLLIIVRHSWRADCTGWLINTPWKHSLTYVGHAGSRPFASGSQNYALSFFRLNMHRGCTRAKRNVKVRGCISSDNQQAAINASRKGRASAARGKVDRSNPNFK